MYLYSWILFPHSCTIIAWERPFYYRESEYPSNQIQSKIITENGNHVGYFTVLKACEAPWDSVTSLYDHILLTDNENLTLSYDIKPVNRSSQEEYVHINLFDCRENKRILYTEVVPTKNRENKQTGFTYQDPMIFTGRLLIRSDMPREGREIFIDNIFPDKKEQST